MQAHVLHATATHCNTLQHTLQHTATHCNTLQHTATPCNTAHKRSWICVAVACNTIELCCSWLQHTRCLPTHMWIGAQRPLIITTECTYNYYSMYLQLLVNVLLITSKCIIYIYYVHKYIYIYVYTYMCIYVCIYIHIFLYVYIYMYIYVCIYMYIYTCTYIHM